MPIDLATYHYVLLVVAGMTFGIAFRDLLAIRRTQKEITWRLELLKRRQAAAPGTREEPQ